MLTKLPKTHLGDLKAAQPLNCPHFSIKLDQTDSGVNRGRKIQKKRKR